MFKLFFDENGTPVNTMYISGSATTYTDHNPSVRLYAFDATTFEILNYTVYYSNITAANEAYEQTQSQDSFVIEKMYDPLSAYDLPDVSPASLYKLVQTMETDDELWNLYSQHFMDNGPNYECTGLCRSRQLCSMKCLTYSCYAKCLA